MTDLGVCYSFNLNLAEMFSVETEFFTIANNVTIDIEENEILKNHEDEIYNTDNLNIFIHSYPGYIDEFCSSFHEGFKLMIHNSDEYPSSKLHSFIIPYNKLSDIVIKPSLFKIHDNAEKLPYQTRRCYKNDEKKLKYFKNYNQINCELECSINKSIEIFNCSCMILPIKIDIQICEFNKLSKCIRQFGHSASCECLPKCKRISYANTELHNYGKNLQAYKYIFTRKQNDLFPILEEDHNDTLINPATIFEETHYISIDHYLDLEKIFSTKSNIITIFYRDTKFVETVVTATFLWSEFLAHCGGLLGLSLGISVLSIIEVFYYFITHWIFNFEN